MRSRASYSNPNLSAGFGSNDYYEEAKASTSHKKHVSNPYGGQTSSNIDLTKKVVSKKSFSFPFRILPWLSSIICLALFLLSRHQVNNSNEKLTTCQTGKQDELSSCNNRLHNLERSNMQLAADSKRSSTSDAEVKSLRKELEIQEQQLASNAKNGKVDLDKKVAGMKKREDAWRNRINLLTKKIERESYREVLEGYGPSPHRVKFQVDIPRDSEKDANIPEDEYPSFEIELYPIDEMPHAVHLFLEQVYHGLWDGCSFVVNAPHILQAGTYPGKGVEMTYAEKVREFERVGLDVVSYQEYNKEYPHKQWSVGFAGRPGGPDFYINKLDNTKNHGPGGQSHHDLEEEADPCFGEIVEGKDVMERMYKMSANRNNDWLLDNPVHIIKARIVDMDDVKEAKTIPHLSDMHEHGTEVIWDDDDY